MSDDGTRVIKFGGTSLATAARVLRAAARVRAHLRRGRSVVVVVSAAAGATDRILARAARVSGAAAARETDRALATGEELSAALLAAALVASGVRARSLRGGEAGVEAVGEFGAGGIRRVHDVSLRRLLERGIVPVVSGFQGRRDDGETLTLGRGGSDTSAVAIAAALRAPCDIVTDVEGVFDRDPRTDPAALRHDELTHAELLELADAGARVVHPAAARLALEHGVDLRIYHFRAPLSGRAGTRVRAEAWSGA